MINIIRKKIGLKTRSLRVIKCCDNDLIKEIFSKYGISRWLCNYQALVFRLNDKFLNSFTYNTGSSLVNNKYINNLCKYNCYKTHKIQNSLNFHMLNVCNIYSINNVISNNSRIVEMKPSDRNEFCYTKNLFNVNYGSTYKGYTAKSKLENLALKEKNSTFKKEDSVFGSSEFNSRIKGNFSDKEYFKYSIKSRSIDPGYLGNNFGNMLKKQIFSQELYKITEIMTSKIWSESSPRVDKLISLLRFNTHDINKEAINTKYKKSHNKNLLGNKAFDWEIDTNPFERNVLIHTNILPKQRNTTRNLDDSQNLKLVLDTEKNNLILKDKKIIYGAYEDEKPITIKTIMDDAFYAKIVKNKYSKSITKLVSFVCKGKNVKQCKSSSTNDDIASKGLVFRKPVVNNTIIQEPAKLAQNVPVVEKSVSSPVIAPTAKPNRISDIGPTEINLLAESVFKILEKRIAIQKDRRGL